MLIPEKHKKRFIRAIIFGVITLVLIAVPINLILLFMWPVSGPVPDHVYTNADSAGTYLAMFILGVIFFPSALRRYRMARREGIKVAWYQRLEILLCMYGLLSGPFCLLSLWLRWAEFMTANNLTLSGPLLFGNGNVRAMAGVDFVLSGSWLAFMILLLYQGFKWKKRQEKDTSVS